MPAEKTVGLSENTKSKLDNIRDGLGFESHDETVRWLVDEVRR